MSYPEASSPGLSPSAQIVLVPRRTFPSIGTVNYLEIAVRHTHRKYKDRTSLSTQSVPTTPLRGSYGLGNRRSLAVAFERLYLSPFIFTLGGKPATSSRYR